MASEENKDIVRRYVEEVWGRHDLAAALELLAPYYVDHHPPPGVTPDREGFMSALDIFAAAFPDAELTLNDLVAEGDRVADRWTLAATHTGSFFGIAPTYRRVILTGMDLHRIVDGQITDTWHVEDILGLLRQLGVEQPKAT